MSVSSDRYTARRQVCDSARTTRPPTLTSTCSEAGQFANLALIINGTVPGRPLPMCWLPR